MQKADLIFLSSEPYPFKEKHVLEADLVIGGSGEDEDLLQSLAKKNPHIHFLGHLDQPEVINLMTASDVYLQPSEFEGQSNSLLEALS